MNSTFIATTFNESETIDKFMNSLLLQSHLPDEIIIVDGGSMDKTVQQIKKYEVKSKKLGITFRLLVKKGNRSVGRNEAIRNASGSIIVCSDFGNRLDKDWMKNIIKPFRNKKVDVVAGYYKAETKNVFQQCLVPYVFVMPDKVNPMTFLPATRSVAFTKKIWEKVGGFPEEYSHNEDYVFAHRLRDFGAEIIFAKDAIVYWFPRNTFKEAFVMFARFAYGDAEAGIVRNSVLILFGRYIFGFYILFLAMLYRSVLGFAIVIVLVASYMLYSIYKSNRYVSDIRKVLYFPAIQFTADSAVIIGTFFGLLRRL